MKAFDRFAPAILAHAKRAIDPQKACRDQRWVLKQIASLAIRLSEAEALFMELATLANAARHARQTKQHPAARIYLEKLIEKIETLQTVS